MKQLCRNGLGMPRLAKLLSGGISARDLVEGDW
jgi:hypothetical protein